MTLSITKTLTTARIHSDITTHDARWDFTSKGVAWQVSWWDTSVFGERDLTQEEAIAAIELAEIVARGRDGGPDTTNYAYFTWERVKELAEVLGVIPLKTVLYLESLAQDAEGPERSDPERNPSD